MIEKTRISVSISLCLLTIALIFHLVAMGHARWKVYENPKMSNKTLSIGVFHRCECRMVNIALNSSKIYSVCDDNKYCFHGNENCKNLTTNPNQLDTMQEWCNLDHNPYNCDYSSITKGLISCTIIAACTLGLSFLLIFSHVSINVFKYKIHMWISIITIPLLFLGFIFILITLILFASTLSYDLYQYRYNLDYRLGLPNNPSKDSFRKNITDEAHLNYNTRLDWAYGLEIGALISSCFTLVTEIIYLFSTYRNRMG